MHYLFSRDPLAAMVTAKQTAPACKEYSSRTTPLPVMRKLTRLFSCWLLIWYLNSFPPSFFNTTNRVSSCWLIPIPHLSHVATSNTIRAGRQAKYGHPSGRLDLDRGPQPSVSSRQMPATCHALCQPVRRGCILWIIGYRLITNKKVYFGYQSAETNP